MRTLRSAGVVGDGHGAGHLLAIGTPIANRCHSRVAAAREVAA